MKRFIISLSLILLFVIAAVFFDQWYMYGFAEKMNEGVDQLIISMEDAQKRSDAVEILNKTFRKARPIINQLVFANRLEEVETVLYKLNAYIEIGDEREISATAEELRSRVNLLSSADLYYRNHASRFGIN